MMSPDVPEFIPHRVRPSVNPVKTGPMWENEWPQQTIHGRPQSGQQSMQKFERGERSQRNVIQSKHTFDDRGPGSFSKGRTNSYNIQVKDKNSVRSYDNWRQRADGLPPDLSPSYDRSANRFVRKEPDRNGSKDKYHQGNKRLWRGKNEAHYIKENNDCRERKGTVGDKNPNTGDMYVTVLKPQSSSFCRPGVSYGKILSGDSTNLSRVGNQKNSTNLGMNAKTPSDDQWPSLGGSNQRSQSRNKNTGEEVVRPDNENPTNTVLCMERKTSNTNYNGAIGPCKEKVIGNVTGLNEHNHEIKNARGVETRETNYFSKKKEQNVHESKDSDFPWQVQKNRRKQMKSQDGMAKVNWPAVKLKGEKGKIDSKSMTSIVSKKAPPNVESISKDLKHSKKLADRMTDKQKMQTKSSGPKDSPGVDNAFVDSNTVTEGHTLSLTARKQKKAEKMMKREQKIKEAENLKKKDSRISMISKAFLESACSTSNSKTWSPVAMGGHDGFENFPNLSEQRLSSHSKSKKSQSRYKEYISAKTQHAGKEATAQPRRNEIAGDPMPTVSSYSGILLTTPKKTKASVPIIVEDNQNMEDKTSAIQKKKVTTKDRVNLDILSAALYTKKLKEKGRKDKNFLSDFYPVQDRSRRNLDVTRSSRNTFAGSLVAKAKGTLVTAPKSYRGFQRETNKVRLSSLKKRMRRAKLQEAEALLAVVREAKKVQEKLIQEAILKDQTVALSSLSLNEESDLSLETDGKDSDRSKNAVEEDAEIKAPAKAREDHQSEVKTEVNNATNDAVADVYNESKENSPAKESLDIDLQTGVVTENTSEMLLKDLQPLKDSEKDALSNELKKMIKEIKSYEVSPVEVGNGLASLGDLELSKRCSDLAEEIKIIRNTTHKHTFREYCAHIVTPEIDETVQQLIKMLVRFQNRQFQKDPLKAKTRRRYVCGLKETKKLISKMSCIIVAPDIKRSRGPGLLDELVMKLLDAAMENGVPLIFALSMRKLGRLCFKKVGVCCVGIISYQGAHDVFSKLMELVPVAKAKYEELVKKGLYIEPTDKDVSDDETDQEKNPKESVGTL